MEWFSRAADLPRDRRAASPATVKTLISRLPSKLEVRDRAQAIVFAYQPGGV